MDGAAPRAPSTDTAAWLEQPSIDQAINGVRMGLESYSLTTLPHEGILDVLIRLMVDTGLPECGLMELLIQPSGLAEKVRQARSIGSMNAVSGPTSGDPASLARAQQAALAAANDAVKQWRITVSFDYFRSIRKKFDAAGIDLYTYTPSALTVKFYNSTKAFPIS